MYRIIPALFLALNFSTFTMHNMENVSSDASEEASDEYIYASETKSLDSLDYNDDLFNFLRPSTYNDQTIENIRQCIAYGADINCQNEWGQTPLAYAVKNNAPHNILNLLIAQGADAKDLHDMKKTALNDKKKL